MATHGKIPDLLDERYLNLHDVFGNVQPFPTLVPYEQYVQSMIVYRLDTDHEYYLPLLQDFTDRYVRSGQTENYEAWTWLLQWDVEPPSPDLPATHVAKKQRMDNQVDVTQKKGPERPKKPFFTHIQRRYLHQELFQEEDIMRILIAIVQVDSKLVPNFIEFLYQWIDYYEGGGSALKAAVREEIPSLWKFDFHPRALFRTTDGKEDDGLDKAAEKMGEKFNKHKKPLAIQEMERLTEQSERMKYREVKYGIQRPINPDSEPIPPLINIPYERKKREQYYGACFRNRTTALELLKEAGMTAAQVANYKKLQPMSPLETPEDANAGGFLNYYKEEPAAHAAFLEWMRTRQIRHKQREAAMSTCLAVEAAKACGIPQADSSFRPPLIPLKATYEVRFSESTAAWLAKTKKANLLNQETPITYVPAPMVGKCKAKAFAFAMARPPHSRADNSYYSSSDDEDDSDDEEEFSDPDDIDPDEREDELVSTTAASIPMRATAVPTMAATIPTAATAPTTATMVPTTAATIPMAAATIATQFPVPGAPTVQPSQTHSAMPPDIQTYIQNLSHAQVLALLPRLQPHAQQAILRQRAGPNVLRQPLQHPGGIPNIASPPQGTQGAVAIPGTGVIHGPGVTRGPVAPHGPGVAQVPGNIRGPGVIQGQGAMEGSGATLPMNHPLQQHLAMFRQQQARTQTLGTSQPIPNATQSHTNPVLPSPPTGPTFPVRLQYSQRETQARQAVMQAFFSFPPLPPQMWPGFVPSGSMSASSPNPLPVMRPVQNPTAPLANIPAVARMQINVQGSIQGATPNKGNNAPKIPQQVTGKIPRAPAALTFAEVVERTARAPPPPSLDLHRSPTDTPSSHTANANREPSIPITPLQKLTDALSLASPTTQGFREDPSQATYPYGVPVQIYLPKIVLPKDGDLESATDCMLLGYTKPETGEITFSKAIFLPTNVWENMLRRVQRGHAQVLESYRPPPNHPRFVASRGTLRNPDEVKGPHRYVYTKLEQIYNLMTSCEDREEELTKRWRISPGPMTGRKRGAVWEGWGLYVDRPIEMGYEERHGVGSTVRRSMDGKRGFGLSESEWQYKLRSMRELDEMLEEEGSSEEDDSDAGDEMEE
ncbi:hypothetical protein GRF29_8g3027698 [Pseudopithomyces chartarum]|uniref:Uncharacterized protein n=1 Tax=Pseudopithomyces chartarum TaxID=1892770 RepID=A0AAN6M8J0_9PLEO|nr:hypothetical protein GRF29_8g3027698 [Pseudopithomyces chartarum]